MLRPRRERSRSPHDDVISSGNSVHVTITIASRVPLSRDSFRKKICFSSLRAALPIPRSKIGQKPLEMDFDRLFHPPSLPSFLFLLKFSHEKLCKKGQRNRLSLPNERTTERLKRITLQRFGASAVFWPASLEYAYHVSCRCRVLVLRGSTSLQRKEMIYH